ALVSILGKQGAISVMVPDRSEPTLKVPAVVKVRIAGVSRRVTLQLIERDAFYGFDVHGDVRFADIWDIKRVLECSDSGVGLRPKTNRREAPCKQQRDPPHWSHFYLPPQL